MRYYFSLSSLTVWCLSATVVLGMFYPCESKAASVVPLVLDYTLEVRAIEHTDIVVTNHVGAVTQLFPTVNNVTVGTSGGINSFVAPSMSDRTSSLSSWLELSRMPLELGPGVSATTTLTIRVNPDAEPGTYHAFISFPEGRNREEAEASVLRGGVPGTMLTVTIVKKTVEDMGLSGFRVDRFVFSPDNHAASYLVQNTGDTEMRPSGDILIYNHRGAEVASIEVNPEGLIIKPGEEKTFTAAIPTAGLIGKYKAYLTMRYGVSQRGQLQDTAFFYVVPWKKLLVLFFGLSLVAIALSLLVHRRYQRDEYDDEMDDGTHVPVYVREGVSGAVHHDIDMTPRI
jgi:hypothetical protein